MIKKLAYISLCASTIGASIISLDFGVFHISIFRAVIIIILLIIFTRIVMKKNTLILAIPKENSYSTKFMIIWLIYSIMTLGWVKDYSGWIKAVFFISLGVICILIYSNVFKTKDDIIKAFKIIFIMILFHNSIAWYEVTTGNYLFLTNSQEIYAIYKYPVSMFGNTNNFALFLLLSICILYILISNTKKIYMKIIYLGTMISSIYLLIMTSSRANILGLILAITFFMFMSIKSKRVKKKLIICLIFLLVVILFKPDIIINIFTMIDQKLYFKFFEGSGSDVTRLNLIKNGIYFLIITFGFGTGAGNIEYWMANYSIYFTRGIVNIHNWWMEILTGYGILIFILYMIFYFKLFTSIYRKYKCSKDLKDSTISLGVMSFMIGFIIASISSSSNIYCEWLWAFWGLVIAYQGNSIDSKVNLLDV